MGTARRKRVIEDYTPANDMGYGNVDLIHVSALQAVRRHCWACQGGHEEAWRMADNKVELPYRPTAEVRTCPSKTCWLHPYRMGRSPQHRGRGNAANFKVVKS
jgi:hypothetical protein